MIMFTDWLMGGRTPEYTLSQFALQDRVLTSTFTVPGLYAVMDGLYVRSETTGRQMRFSRRWRGEGEAVWAFTPDEPLPTVEELRIVVDRPMLPLDATEVSMLHSVQSLLERQFLIRKVENRTGQDYRHARAMVDLGRILYLGER